MFPIRLNSCPCRAPAHNVYELSRALRHCHGLGQLSQLRGRAWPLGLLPCTLAVSFVGPHRALPQLPIDPPGHRSPAPSTHLPLVAKAPDGSTVPIATATNAIRPRCRPFSAPSPFRERPPSRLPLRRPPSALNTLHAAPADEPLSRYRQSPYRASGSTASADRVPAVSLPPMDAAFAPAWTPCPSLHFVSTPTDRHRGLHSVDNPTRQSANQPPSACCVRSSLRGARLPQRTPPAPAGLRSLVPRSLRPPRATHPFNPAPAHAHQPTTLRSLRTELAPSVLLRAHIQAVLTFSAHFNFHPHFHSRPRRATQPVLRSHRAAVATQSQLRILFGSSSTPQSPRRPGAHGLCAQSRLMSNTASYS